MGDPGAKMRKILASYSSKKMVSKSHDDDGCLTFLFAADAGEFLASGQRMSPSWSKSNWLE